MKNIELEFDPVSEPKQQAHELATTAAASPFISVFLTYDQVVELDEFGEPKLKDRRQRQLVKELKEYDEAEQYALLATKSQPYPCSKCPKPDIFLSVGNVWKYGATRKGEIGRYGTSFLLENDLDYFVQVFGTWQECLTEEKKKIFNYPLLPENQRRPLKERLAMPPGNLRTD